MENLKKQLAEQQQRLNDEANRQWRNDRMYQVSISNKSTEEKLILELEIGRWDTQAFYTVEVFYDEDSNLVWKIIRKSSHNKNFNDAINFIIRTIEKHWIVETKKG